MRKSMLFFIALVAGVWTAVAQDGRVTYVEADNSDVTVALQSLNVEIFKLQFPVDTTASYNAMAILEEYRGGELVNTERVALPPTMQRIRYQGQEEWTLRFWDKAAIVVNANDDDAVKLRIALTDVMSMGLPLKTDTTTIFDGTRRIPYGTRPFMGQDFAPGVKIPVLLYGSYWLDERFGIYRFCGERELSPELSNELMERCPHFFVISFEFSRNDDHILDLKDRQ